MRELEFLPGWYQARKRRRQIRARRTRWAVGLVLCSATVVALKSIPAGRAVAPAASQASSIPTSLPGESSATVGQSSVGLLKPAFAGQKEAAPDNTANALRKSDATQADQNSELQQRLQNLRQQAAEGLQLRSISTVTGATPKALVNGELLGEGDVVACGSGETRAAYRVLKIEARRIIVEREGIKLEIPMR